MKQKFRFKSSCKPIHIMKRITLTLTGLFFLLGISVVSAENASQNKSSSHSTTKGDDLSTDSLNKQINDLDAQIQKLRDQSLDLQEKTRAKLQAQLDTLKKQQDTLIPRIERLRENSETAWKDIKENIQKAIEDLKHSVEAMEK